MPNYIICQIILVFLLVVSYNLLEDRCIDDNIDNLFVSLFLDIKHVISYR